MSLTYLIYKDVAPGAEGDATPSATGVSSFSNVALLPHGKTMGKIATLEQNQWLLDGEHGFLDNDVVAFWSADLSGEDCVMATPPVIDISFGENYSSSGVSIEFDPMGGNYCTEVNIKWLRDGSVLSDMDFQPNATTYFFANAVEAYDQLIFTFNKTNLPLHRVKINHILFGVSRRFDMEVLRSSSIVRESNLISAEIPASTLDVTIDDQSNIDFLFQLKQPIEAFNDNISLGAFYIKEHKRNGKSVYSLNCHDAWGVLDESGFDGGVYENASAFGILESIVDPEFILSFADGLEDKQLTGVIQPCTRREAAQQVLFAVGWATATDDGAEIKVFSLPDNLVDVGENRTYSGASSEISAITTEVKVAAHKYTESSNGNIEIGGKKYNDTTTIYTVKNPAVSSTDKSSVVEVTDATLVSNDNAQEVAERVYNYYQMRQRDSAKIVWQGERIGDMVKVPTEWGNAHTGRIEKMTIKLSNVVAADLDVVGVIQGG